MSVDVFFTREEYISSIQCRKILEISIFFFRSEMLQKYFSLIFLKYIG